MTQRPVLSPVQNKSCTQIKPEPDSKQRALHFMVLDNSGAIKKPLLSNKKRLVVNIQFSSHLPETFCRNWHHTFSGWLSRFRRACPSTSLDKSVQLFGCRVIYSIKRWKIKGFPTNGNPTSVIYFIYPGIKDHNLARENS